jgi:hypothetical protein
MKIEYVDSIPGTSSPARVFHDTGVIQINLSRWNQLPPFTQKYIKAHEEGHYLGRTNNEFKADKYAFLKLAFTEPESLRNSVKALSDVLPYTTPEHSERVKAQIIRSLAADWVVNKNAKALEALNQMQTAYHPEQFQQIVSKLNSSFDGSNTLIDTKNIAIAAGLLILIVAITYFITRK